MCYTILRAEAGVDESDHHALVIAGGNRKGTRYFNTGCACFPWFLSFGNRTQGCCCCSKSYVQFTPFYLLLFIIVGPITKLFAWGRGRVEDTCYEIQRAEAVWTSLTITHK
jgi:hypothetical protein